tara:strand:+ start:12298 stop:12975 length:678 start_codon:yes stop_codon:yes gene_type:complete
MKTALVFANQGTIDFSEVRSNVIRIPEVVATLKEAQICIDQICPNPVDLISFMSADDTRFWSTEKFRKLCVGLVQIGLCRRYYKSKEPADVLVCAEDVYSPVKVLTSTISLKEYVELCLFQQDSNEVFQLSSGVLPQKLEAYKLTDEGYKVLIEKQDDVESMIVQLREDHAIGRVINVGPCNTLVSSYADPVLFSDMQVEELINMDPMLTWFWDSMSRDLQGIAN